MFQTGLVSITFRHLSPVEIVNLVSQAGLQSIEWGGDIHVPHGDTRRAREVHALTNEADLNVAAYGSYYRVGKSEDEGLSFRNVLHTALELGAPVLRVWAGVLNSEDADEKYRQLIVNETRHICQLAEQTGILVALEFHGGTLTNTAASTQQLLEAVNHPNLRTLWQPRVGASTPEALADLRALLPWLAHLHVFQWDASKDDFGKITVDKRPLREGENAWREYLTCADNDKKVCPALIEYVQDDAPESFLADAQTLRSWVDQQNCDNQNGANRND